MIKKTYSFTANGHNCEVYTLQNKVGAEADIMTYGGRVLRLTAPDKNGVLGDVIVGYKTPEEYLKSGAYYGALIGRYGNRIGGSAFSLGGKTYTLQNNEGKNTLHGGFDGFDKKVWKAEINGEKLVLSYVSMDGEGGYPGTLEIKVAYSLDDSGEFAIEYEAKSDKDTVANLTNHAYFNIGDDDDILEQTLYINSSRITPTDDELIPSGKYLDIAGTPFDFSAGKKLKTDMFSDEHLIKHCKGFDFNYCLDRVSKDGLELAASVFDQKSGRKMDCFTTLPGVQLYTSNTVSGVKGKKVYGNYSALCLETQFYPNSPNCPEYPSTVIKAGEVFKSKTIYKFSVVK